MVNYPDEETPHILVIDDDRRIRSLLQKYLHENGFRASTAADAMQAQDKMNLMIFDLLVLDIMMPEVTGLEFTEKLRNRQNNVPILLLTAKSETEDRIKGLGMGADDYLTKPFDPQELLLRINNILRRVQMERSAPTETVEEVRFGAFHFHLERGELTRNGARISLTTREIDVLRKLAIHPGRAITRDEFFERHNVSPRAVDVQMNRLRRKVEDNPHDPIYIQTVRGSGYILRTD